MRLDKLLEQAGYGSRRRIKRLIKSKQISVDGAIVLEEGYNVDTSLQVLKVQKKIIQMNPHAYFMLNKPSGHVSAVKDQEHETVIDLISQADRRPGLFPVGRLDRDSQGLMLITNNGKLAHELLVPNKNIKKTYEAIVNAEVTSADISAFEKGVIFDSGEKCKPAQLKILSSGKAVSHVCLEISEGKFHQVKKMFLTVGKKVIFLKRISMGPLKLDGSLLPGSYRRLTKEELAALKKFFK